MKSNCQLNSYCKPKLNTGRLRAWACTSALLGSMWLYPIEQAKAQVCGTGLGATLGLSDINGNAINASSRLRIGDQIRISLVTVQNGSTSYRSINDQGRVIFPNGSSRPAILITDLQAGGDCVPGGQQSGWRCPANAPIGVPPVPTPTCLPGINDIHTITFADLATSQGLTLCNGQRPPLGTVLFKLVVEGVAIDEQGAFTGDAGACASIFIPLIFPCITVTKECVNPCTSIGQPIQFRGQVCNTGDSRVTGVTLVDNPPATINFAATTSTGRAYDGSLNAGECINYTGSYQPGGAGAALCGPFTDTITATAIDASGRTVTNTDPCINPQTGQSTGPRPPVTATCHVRTTPCIDLTKDCAAVTPCIPGNPRSVKPGDSYTETFTVRNCGDVGLRNVRVNDSIAGVIPITGSASCPQAVLEPGQSCTVTITRNAPLGSCAPITDRAVATGDQLCPPDALCPSPATVSSSERTCSLVVCCPPRICIEKLVTCKNPGVACENATGYAKTAVGFRTPTQNPAFCYRITITNCGPVDLTNVVVVDDHLGDLTANFFASPGIVFPVGGSATHFFSMAWPSDTTNTVTATGQSVRDGSGTTTRDSAVVQVVVASIQCVKLVTSPADLDGNPNDNHVTVPADGADHPVTYRVRISAGSADLSNVAILDPMLAGLGCTLPAPFSLAANATTTIELCTVTRSCLSSTSDCANPQLGAAAGCTVLQLDSSKVDMTGPPGGVSGDVCIGPGGRLSMSGSQYISGRVRLAPGATFSRSGATTVGGILTNVDLSAEINAAYATAARLATQSCTQTFATLNRSTTILGNGGTNVLCVQNVDLNGGAVVTLQGNASDVFIVNVTGKFKLTGGSRIVAAGGVPNRNILYNVIGTGEQVAFSGGGGGVNCCASSVDGTLLAPQRKIALSPGLVNGAVISAMDISIVSGASVRCPPGQIPPPLVNTLTVSAQVDALAAQGCAYDVNGEPIRVGCTSSATVECNGPNAARQQVAMRMIDHVCQLSCATEAGKAYKVQYTDSLSTLEWTDLADFVGTGSIVILNDLGGGPQRFYRLIVVP